jgi:hypothetical protein
MRFLSLLKSTIVFTLLTAILISCGGDDESATPTPTPAPAPTITSFTPTSGLSGAAVVITGTNFSTTPAQNTVKFGTVLATVTASTATSITTSVPAGASTGTISVTVNDVTATSATPFTVETVPTPLASFSFTGNANDESGNNRATTVKGAALTTDRNNNQNAAYLFNGQNSIEVTNTTGIGNPNFSFAMWVKLTQLPPQGSPGDPAGLYTALSIGNAAGDQTIVLSNQYFGITTSTGFGSGSYTSTSPVTVTSVYTGALPAANTWIHLAVTRSNTELKLYINGTLSTSATATAIPLYTTPIKFVIGARYNGSQGFVGAIDEVKVYGSVLTAAQIAALAN